MFLDQYCTNTYEKVFEDVLINLMNFLLQLKLEKTTGSISARVMLRKVIKKTPVISLEMLGRQKGLQPKSNLQNVEEKQQQCHLIDMLNPPQKHIYVALKNCLMTSLKLKSTGIQKSIVQLYKYKLFSPFVLFSYQILSSSKLLGILWQWMKWKILKMSDHYVVELFNTLLMQSLKRSQLKKFENEC